MSSIKNSSCLDDDLEEVLPDGVAKRIRIENPIDPPTTVSGDKIFDYDVNGILIDVYFENTRPRYYVISPTIL